MTGVRAYEGGLGPAFEQLLHRADEREALEARRGLRALELAPTLEIYQALMRGDEVPLDLLNRDATIRYGLRRAP